MSTDPADSREQLFTRYSKQLELYGEEPTGIFVCPLCMITFTRESLAARPPQVSLAHIVPKALGGTSCTLTCTTCNNASGGGMESDLAALLRYDDWCKGVGTSYARVTGSFGDVGVKLGLSPDGSKVTFQVVDKWSHRDHFAAMETLCRQYAEDPRTDFSLNVTFQKPHRPRQVLGAVYQSAFLLMFKYFGYECVFRPEYAPLREQVLRPEEEIWPGRVNVLSPIALSGMLGAKDSAVVFLRKPFEAILAVLRYRSEGGDHVRGVLLPPPGLTAVPQLERGEIEGTAIPYRHQVITKSKRHISKLWNWVRKRSECGGQSGD